MKKIQKFVLGLFVALASLTNAQAAGGSEIAWDKAPYSTTDLGSLQNGAKLFVNYCLNCHAASRSSPSGCWRWDGFVPGTARSA